MTLTGEESQSQFNKVTTRLEKVAKSQGNKPSGLYIVRPRWWRNYDDKHGLKLGLTKSLRSRTSGAYKHTWPYHADSFAILGWLSVGENELQKREAKMLQLTDPGFGMRKEKWDDEWRFSNLSEARTLNQIRLLLKATRTQADGNWYVIDESGDVVFRGGRQGEIDPENYIPPGADRVTRADTAAGRRQIYTNPVEFNRRYVSPAGRHKGSTASAAHPHAEAASASGPGRTARISRPKQCQ
jgi:hypothetical protein